MIPSWIEPGQAAIALVVFVIMQIDRILDALGRVGAWVHGVRYR